MFYDWENPGVWRKCNEKSSVTAVSFCSSSVPYDEVASRAWINIRIKLIFIQLFWMKTLLSWIMFHVLWWYIESRPILYLVGIGYHDTVISVELYWWRSEAENIISVAYFNNISALNLLKAKTKPHCITSQPFHLIKQNKRQ